MIALVLFTVFSLAQSQTCQYTAAVTATDGTVTSPATCVHQQATTPITHASCTDEMRACYANRDETSCHARRGDDIYCTWLSEGDGMNSGGICINHPVELCAGMMDCILGELAVNTKMDQMCVDATDSGQNGCTGTSLAATAASVASVTVNGANLMQAYQFNQAVLGFVECVDITTSARNTEAGGEWLFCNDMIDDDPCNSGGNSWIEENVECRGEESCEGKRFQGSVVCSGVDSCGEATFKPSTSTTTVKCIGDSSCEDVDAKKRDDIDDDDEDSFVYTCSTGSSTELRDVCRGGSFKDNTWCKGRNACEDAVIDAVGVWCDDGEGSCSDAEITAEEVLCSGEDTPCSQAKITVNQLSCGAESACVDAEISLGKGMGSDLEDPRVQCTEEDSCARATFKYMLPLIEGNESLRCVVPDSCTDATIKVEAHCVAAGSCTGAHIAKDVICGDADACTNTHMTQGTICCGPGCEKANTLDDFGVAYEEEDDVGCKEDVKSMKTHPTYEDYDCKRCGKETLIGWITDNKTNLVIAIIVCILVLLIVLFIVGFILKKAGILQICMKCDKNSEEAEEE